MEEMINRRFPGFQFITRPLEDIFEHSLLSYPNAHKAFETISGSRRDYGKLCTISDKSDPSPRTEHFVNIVSNETAEKVGKAARLRKLFDSIDKTTAKEDLYRSMKMTMLARIAQREG